MVHRRSPGAEVPQRGRRALWRYRRPLHGATRRPRVLGLEKWSAAVSRASSGGVHAGGPHFVAVDPSRRARRCVSAISGLVQGRGARFWPLERRESGAERVFPRSELAKRRVSRPERARTARRRVRRLPPPKSAPASRSKRFEIAEARSMGVRAIGGRQDTRDDRSRRPRTPNALPRPSQPSESRSTRGEVRRLQLASARSTGASQRHARQTRARRQQRERRSPTSAAPSPGQ